MEEVIVSYTGQPLHFGMGEDGRQQSAQLVSQIVQQALAGLGGAC